MDQGPGIRDQGSGINDQEPGPGTIPCGSVMRRVFVDPGAPQRDALQEAAKWIRNGGLVALPTDTLYGLAADPFSTDAVARVFTVKGRSAGRGLPLIAADIDQIAARLGALPPNGRRLAEKFWPGPLTLLVPAPAALAREVDGGT